MTERRVAIKTLGRRSKNRNETFFFFLQRRRWSMAIVSWGALSSLFTSYRVTRVASSTSVKNWSHLKEKMLEETWWRHAADVVMNELLRTSFSLMRSGYPQCLQLLFFHCLPGYLSFCFVSFWSCNVLNDVAISSSRHPPSNSQKFQIAIPPRSSIEDIVPAVAGILGDGHIHSIQRQDNQLFLNVLI